MVTLDHFWPLEDAWTSTPNCNAFLLVCIPIVACLLSSNPFLCNSLERNKASEPLHSACLFLGFSEKQKGRMNE